MNIISFLNSFIIFLVYCGWSVREVESVKIDLKRYFLSIVS